MELGTRELQNFPQNATRLTLAADTHLTGQRRKSERYMRLFYKRVRRVVARVAPFCLSVPALSLSLGACTGVLGGSSSGNGNNGQAGGSGNTGGSTANGGSTNGMAGTTSTAGAGQNPDQGSPIQAAPTWRLTNLEYVNSVRDLLKGVRVTTPLDPDGAMAGYRAGLVAGDATVAAYRAAAIEAAAAANVVALVPCDAATVTAKPAECAAKFIDAVAPQAYRRALDADSRAALVGLYTTVSAKFGFEAGVRAMIEEVLQSPYFLYHLELEEQAKGPGAVKVSGYSMASRLS
jgi:Protein of unknown function (DUF1595)/Protein of unknown function (DUF1587)